MNFHACFIAVLVFGGFKFCYSVISDEASDDNLSPTEPERKVDIAQFPWQLYLLTKEEDGGVGACGAVLIARRWALTTAHCMGGVQSAYVLGGANRWVDMLLGRAGAQVGVRAAFLHPGYDGTNIHHDLALLWLERVNRTVPLEPIRILASSLVFGGIEGKPVTITGWGASVGFSHLLSPQLQSAELKVMRRELCVRAYGAAVAHSNVMCAQGLRGSAVGICKGDSGVGVSYRLGQRDYLVGIAGFRDKSCAQGAPTGFTSVEFYVPWILTVMEQQEGVASLGE